MHTKLPEFIDKMEKAAQKGRPETGFALRGLENLKSAKMQSLRTGRIEEAVAELAARPDVERVELVVMPRVPETMHTVVIKGIAADGGSPKAIVEVVNILHPTEEVELENCREVEDRRPAIGRH
jgi:hypothetical protein